MIKIGAIIVLAGAIGGDFIKQKTAKPVEEEQVTQVNAPAFNADSAYTYISEQCNFGPRTMKHMSNVLSGLLTSLRALVVLCLNKKQC